MHQWTVEGAHKVSGRELVDLIEAMTEEEAREEAAKRGILVSSIHLSVVEEIPSENVMHSYMPPGVQSSRQPPTYENIIKGEKWLGVLASVYTVVGILCIVVTAFICVAIIFAIRDGSTAVAAIIVMMEPLVFGLAGAIVCFMSAAFLRFVGSVGLAMRDMARNSF